MEQYIYDESNGLWYRLCGDYYLPCLVPGEENYHAPGHYGRLHRAWLRENRPAVFAELVASGALPQVLEEIDRSCQEQMTTITEAMKKREGVTEALKATDQMEWVRRMNSIRNRAEEFVLSELVYN